MQESRVLVVDDKEINRAIIADVLYDQEIEVDEASSGEEALDKMVSSEYALVLMDILMPGMDGFECVRQTHARPGVHSAPVIFVTAARSDQEMLETGYGLGAVDYLTKPIDETALVHKVKAFVSLYESQKKLDAALVEAAQARLRSERLLNYTADGILGTDRKGIITFANVAACTLLTITNEKLIGSNIKAIISPHSSEAVWRQSDFYKIFEDCQCNQVFDVDFWRDLERSFSVQYTQATVFDGLEPIGGVVSFQDINERKITEDKLVALARYDQLTGLINRSTYWETLELGIQTASRKEREIQVLFIDLDHFKEVNDTFGHDVGDQLLVESAHRIESCLRKTDVVCRLGGDEFAIVINEPETIEEGKYVGEKIIETISLPMKLDDKEVYVGASIGVATYPSNGSDATEITRAADMAMYLAKKSGKNCVRYFDQKIQSSIDEKNEYVGGLRSAIENNQLEFYYQPQISLKDQKLAGLEALMRWKHPGKGYISPTVFIPIAEETGLIEQLGDWGFREAIRQAKYWQSQSTGKDKWTLAVNASPLQLKQKGFAKRFTELLEESGLPEGLIDIELTETAVMDDPEAAIIELTDVRDAGVKVSVDDFGTGYSSLSYLKKLPIDILKIDKSFVEDIGKDENDEAIINSIIKLAHSLDLKVVAEGVETREQLDFLKELGCDIAQGYFFSKPVCAEEAGRILYDAGLIHNKT